MKLQELNNIEELNIILVHDSESESNFGTEIKYKYNVCA